MSDLPPKKTLTLTDFDARSGRINGGFGRAIQPGISGVPFTTVPDKTGHVGHTMPDLAGLFGELLAEHQDAGTAVFDDGDILLGRIARVERDHDDSRLPHGNDQLKALVAVVLEGRHPCARLHTQPHECVGQTIGPPVDHLVREGSLLIGQATAVPPSTSRSIL